MSKSIVYALHGFLGQSVDWNSVQNELKKIETGHDVQFLAENLFSKESAPILEFEDYVDVLAEKLESQLEPYENRIFVGYSLGGRLGLHLLTQYPDFFDHFIFISTHPGLTEKQGAEKNNRLIDDMKWAQKISKENWDSFIQDWNAQPVFADGVKDQFKKVEDFDLNLLKRALVMWSLSQQENFEDILFEEQENITWVVGEKDIKFLQIAEDLKQKKILLDYKKILAGHRLHIDQPAFIAQLISEQLV